MLHHPSISEIFFKKLNGEHYQNALRFQEEGRWRNALAELRQGAEEEDGMCYWWLYELCDCERIWGVRIPIDEYIHVLEKGSKNNARCRASFFSIAPKLRSLRQYEQSFLDTNDTYAIAYFYWHWARFGVLEQGERINDLKNKSRLFAKQSSEQGDFAGMYFYGYYHDDNESLELSAKKGFAPAQFQYAQRLMQDEQHIEQALFWLRKAAEQEHYQALELICELLLKQKNYAGALYWLKRRVDGTYPVTKSTAQQIMCIRMSDFQKVERCQESSRMLMGIGVIAPTLPFPYCPRMWSN